MHELADAARPLTLRHFRSHAPVDNKGAQGTFDPVTAADRDAEDQMRRLIAERYPDHAIVGEEHGSTHEQPDVATVPPPITWIIDPVDGTRAFIMGWPLWGTLIAAADASGPLVGLMDQPYTRERFTGDGRTAHLKGPDGRTSKLATRSCGSLRDAVLATTDPGLFAPGHESNAFARVRDVVRMTRYGGDCYAYAMLAAGHTDLVVEAGLNAYDIAALVPIIEGAGGVITTWDGGPAGNGGRIVAAGDRHLHAEALAMLRD
ncbi:MAG: histidinol-phosphatase [Hyphomicrobiaceae bacterium]|nr:histidinol-phosphatase [Hyphomicrobiaceae bacterium]